MSDKMVSALSKLLSIRAILIGILLGISIYSSNFVSAIFYKNSILGSASTFYSSTIQQKYLSNKDPTICGISFEPPWFTVNSKDGTPLLIIDANGNLYINSSEVQQDAGPISTLWKNAFLISVGGVYYWGFNKSKAELYGHIVEDTSPTYDQRDFVVINKQSGEVLAVFDGSTGNILIRGKAAYQGAQAGCPPDGWQCIDSTTAGYLDYYCNAVSGNCAYRITKREYCTATQEEACEVCGETSWYCCWCENGHCTCKCYFVWEDLPDNADCEPCPGGVD